MKKSTSLLVTLAGIGLLAAAWLVASRFQSTSSQFLSYRLDLKEQQLKLYWQDEHGQPLRSLGRLRSWLQGRGEKLVFAMNAGMYKTGNVPLGLYVQEQQHLSPLDTTSGSGNFYLKPNGVFYVTMDNQAGICETAAFGRGRNVRFATQSGPMLVLNGRIHPAFRLASTNRNIRNGVGVLPDGRVLFVLSKQKVTFSEFAEYFQQSGCHNALYLDGLVSRAFLPQDQWVQTDGDFGGMIGVTARQSK